MQINEYLKQVKSRFSTGISTEHSYRADLQNLLNEMVKGITITNEPKRQKCGAPDYIIQRKDIPLGYIEAKDIGVDLNKIEKSEQLIGNTSDHLDSIDGSLSAITLSSEDMEEHIQRLNDQNAQLKEFIIIIEQIGKEAADYLPSFAKHIDIATLELVDATVKTKENLKTPLKVF